MRVRVKLYAVARELGGSPEVTVDVPENATIEDVREALVASVPKLHAVFPHVRWAVDSEFVTLVHPVGTTSEIALIPPVSGG